MRYITITAFFLIVSVLAFRSPVQFTINGTVTDASNGLTLAGVTVSVKGTGILTSTTADGKFSLVIPSDKATIIFNMTGYDKKEVKVKNTDKDLKIQLKAASQNLQEVVVIGYGSRDALSGALPSKSVRAANKSDINSQLYGRTAGTVVTADDKRTKRDIRRDNNNYEREGYDGIVENRFLTVGENPLSTFSIDVDAAAYSNIRRMLNAGQLPPAGAVRIEEMVNYFKYDYPQPVNEEPFSINTEMADCPWNNKHKLVLVGLQGKKIPMENLPPSNLVFLIDVSGSMMDENKLPLVRQSMKLLVDQLREQDRVAIVVYAGSAGLVLPSTSGEEKMKIKDAIDRLEAGGSTAGGAGIRLAYKVAKDNMKTKGNNRVILCTDGDFNIGASSDAAMEDLIEEERKSGVFLTVLGYGTGNYQDAKMQKLADKGNGNHAYVDNFNEARKVLVSEFGGTLFTIAKDVKLQIEFNPAKVQAYRLIGYENRLLNKEDFNNDKKDAGDLGSGHTVTALYEVIPAGVKSDFIEKVDQLKYQQQQKNGSVSATDEIMTIKFRYKQPNEDKSKLIEHPVRDNISSIAKTSSNFRFAAAVAEFGMVLRNSEFKQSSSYEHAWKLAKNALGNDDEGYRSEFLKLIRNAQTIGGNEDDLSNR